MYIENPEGQKTGYDWKTGKTYAEIPDLEINRTIRQDWPITGKFSLLSGWMPLICIVGQHLMSALLHKEPFSIYRMYWNLMSIRISFTSREILNRRGIQYRDFRGGSFPDRLPTVQFVISNEQGECRFDLNILFKGMVDPNLKVDIQIFHNPKTGRFADPIFIRQKMPKRNSICKLLWSAAILSLHRSRRKTYCHQ